MTFNDFAGWLLRSQFYWMMGPATMLICLTGRKSGKPITLPVNFHRFGGELWVTSRRSRVWWRNLQTNPEVTLWIKGRETQARGELVVDEKTVAATLARVYADDPALTRALGLRLRDGAPDPDDLERVAADRLLIKISV